ncbi:hypothetical protein K474DRAFT_618708 [Panus rudis PR-1116 ss-1]|nr:hypothetical protein K474DRAFT_618708 [Panus rudis PR-1116 ss-1]
MKSSTIMILAASLAASCSPAFADPSSSDPTPTATQSPASVDLGNFFHHQPTSTPPSREVLEWAGLTKQHISCAKIDCDAVWADAQKKYDAAHGVSARAVQELVRRLFADDSELYARTSEPLFEKRESIAQKRHNMRRRSTVEDTFML